MPDLTSRRQFLAATGAVLGLGPALAACGGAPTRAAQCDGYGALSTAELQQRQALNYVDVSPRADQNCANCRLYNAPARPRARAAAASCSPGPVVAQGWCTAWVGVVS